MPRLRTEDAVAAPIPLPPLAEQHRIVAKVDELMALCDRLEAARAQREAARDRLARSCLARLDTPDPETFREDARFTLAQRLPDLPGTTAELPDVEAFAIGERLDIRAAKANSAGVAHPNAEWGRVSL